MIPVPVRAQATVLDSHAPAAPPPVDLLRRLQRRHLLCLALPRAVGEALICGALYLALLLLAHVSVVFIARAVLVFAEGTVLLCAWRLRLPQGRWLRQVGYETLAATLLIGGGVLLGLLELQGMIQTGILAPEDVRVATTRTLEALPGTTLFFAVIPYASYRIGIRLWISLTRLGDRYLRWALTYQQVVIFALVIYVVVGLPATWAVWLNLPSFAIQDQEPAMPDALRVFFVLLTGVLPNLALTATLLVIILPLFAAFSYLSTRRATRRLAGLVAATRRLRGGDYSSRIAVEGADEIAHLQADFNILAAKLERTLAALAEEHAQVVREQEKSERLLINILPGPIAERLKAEQQPIVDSFAEVTVLFADLVDFTTLSASLSAEDLVTWLNEIFSAFDALAERHGLEKIKTIGDAYMVVSGLPTARPDHARAAAEMALDMQAEIAQRRAPGGGGLAMRIGLNSGPVVAGVIGTKKFIYDLWGDTVNTASRMESHGVSGSIQATEATYALLQDDYLWEARGPMRIKGKGEMPAYLLRARLPGREQGSAATR